MNASTCSSAECDYEGIKCSDANGNVYTDSCTSYYVECDNGAATAPRAVADGTRCLNGEQVSASACTGASCDFEGSCQGNALLPGQTGEYERVQQPGMRL